MRAFVVAAILAGFSQAAFGQFFLISDRSALPSGFTYQGGFPTWLSPDSSYYVHWRGTGVLSPLVQCDENGNGGTWHGYFQPGERLGYIDGPYGVGNNTASFYASTDSAGSSHINMAALGVEVQTLNYGPSEIQIRAHLISGVYSDWYTRIVESTFTPGQNDAFIGIGYESASIDSVEVRARSLSQTSPGWFAVGTPRASLVPVPEPATLIVVGAACAGLLRRRRGSRG